MTHIRLAMIDHDTLLRESLIACLQAQNGFHMIWATHCLNEALLQFAANEPDALLLDIDLHLRDTFDLVRKISAVSCHTRMIVLTHNASDALIARALDLPVQGYILKDDSMDNLVGGIRRVIEGGVYYSDRIGRRLRIDPARGTHELAAGNRLRSLTLHQLQLVGHLARGASAKEIAKLMHLSVKAINSQKYRIMRRLGIHDRVQLARYAIREGLIPP